MQAQAAKAAVDLPGGPISFDSDRELVTPRFGGPRLSLVTRVPTAPYWKSALPVVGREMGLTWIVDHAEELGVRADALTVGGGSAGANLAAGLTLKVRDQGGPRISCQLLEVPALDLVGNMLKTGAVKSIAVGEIAPRLIEETTRASVKRMVEYLPGHEALIEVATADSGPTPVSTWLSSAIAHGEH